MIAAITHLHFIGECPNIAHCDYWHKTLGLLSDGPHITAELVTDLLENIVIWVIAFTLGRRTLHRRFDKQHGLKHTDDV
jgi:hypothetical protein